MEGWGSREEREGGKVWGRELGKGLNTARKRREPIFTRAKKEESGHDENISFERMCTIVGDDLAAELRDLTLRIYKRAAEFAETRGIIIADTKFEFGIDEHATRGQIIVWIDEALTPDSARFWPAESYAIGRDPPSFHKQVVRDWLGTRGCGKSS